MLIRDRLIEDHRENPCVGGVLISSLLIGCAACRNTTKCVTHEQCDATVIFLASEASLVPNNTAW